MTPADPGHPPGSDPGIREPGEASLPEPVPASDPPEPPPPEPSPPGPPSGPPGAATFTIEGRAAPGLYWLGWIAVISGSALAVVGLLSGGGVASVALLGLGLLVLGIGLVAGAGSQAMERRRAARSAYPGPSPFLVFAAVIPFALLLQVLLVVPLDLVGIDPLSPAGALLAGLVMAGTYLVLLRLLVVDLGSLSWREMGLRRPTRADLVDALLGAGLGIPLVFVAGLLALLLGSFLALPEAPVPEAPDRLGALLNVITAVLVAPIAEEIFFRGFATTAWLRDIGPNRAIVRGAIFFAVVHVLTLGGATFEEGLQMAFVAFVIRLPVAWALGWIFVRRRSLFASIGLHMAYNALPVLVLLGATS